MTAAQAFVINPRIQPPRARSLPFVDMAAVDGSAQYVEASQTRGLGGGSRFEDGDTLMARITPCLENGKIARFRSTDRHGFGFGSTEFIVFRGRDGVTTSDFAFYTVKSRSFRDFAISQMSGTSGRQRVPTTCFEHLHLSIPSIATQQAITAILSALDEKIEINQLAASTLEEMARALFKSWFVDFDPVHAKAEGRDTGLSADIAALFPASVDDEGLPLGWIRTRADAIAQLVRSAADPRAMPRKTPYIGLEHLPRKSLGLGSYGHAGEVESGKLHFKAGDLLFGKLRPYFHKVSVAPFDGIASSEIFVFRAKSERYGALMYFGFSEDQFVASASGASTGTRMPRADWSYMSEQQFTTDDGQVLGVFNEFALSHVSQISERLEECRKLEQLRDTLLPKLLSGELRVADAESVIAAA